MTKEELINIASEGYPDGMIAMYWDKQRQCVDLKSNHGDGLAKFIACEISDTYDVDAADDAQLGEVVRALNTAIRELTSVVRSVAGCMGKDKDGRIRRRKKHHGHEKV